MSRIDDVDDSPPRAPRRSLRRVGGFSASSSSDAVGLRAPTEEEEIETAIEPERIQETIRMNTGQLPAPVEPPPQRGDTITPRQRLAMVANSGSREYAIEYRLNMISRMLMRRVPLDTIAATLGVSISTVEKDRVKIKERHREGAKSLDNNELIGEQVDFYDEVAGMAMQIATGNAPVAMKLAAQRTALTAKADKTRFLTSAGFFDAMKYRKGGSASELSDIQKLMAKTEEVFARAGITPSGDPDAPRPIKRISRLQAFQPMTMDDEDASNSDEEIVEL